LNYILYIKYIFVITLILNHIAMINSQNMEYCFLE